MPYYRPILGNYDELRVGWFFFYLSEIQEDLTSIVALSSFPSRAAGNSGFLQQTGAGAGHFAL